MENKCLKLILYITLTASAVFGTTFITIGSMVWNYFVNCCIKKDGNVVIISPLTIVLFGFGLLIGNIFGVLGVYQERHSFLITFIVIAIIGVFIDAAAVIAYMIVFFGQGFSNDYLGNLFLVNGVVVFIQIPFTITALVCALIFARRINQSSRIAQFIVPSDFNQFHPVQPLLMALPNQADSPNAFQPGLMSEVNQFRSGQQLVMPVALPHQSQSPSSGSTL